MKLKRFSAVLLMLVFAQSSYASDIYDSEPTFSPYYAGSVKSTVLYEALDELNYIRWLIGVPNNVTLDTDYTRKAQHGAVLLDAIDTLTHTPDKPSDMSTSFYELGYDAASHGNIAAAKISSGTSSQGNISLSYSTKLYMKDSDSYNISEVGHRRWLMNPRMTKTGFGISTRNGYAVTYVIEEFSSSNTLTQEEYSRYLEWLKWPISDEFITWPTAKHPHPLSYFDSETAWSVTLNRDIFNTASTSSITVRLTRQRDGRMWTFSASGSDGYFNVTDNNVAYDQCIIFRPEGVESYSGGELWTVEVSGLTRKNGGSGSISYSVQFTNTATGYEEQTVYVEQGVNRDPVRSKEYHYYYDKNGKIHYYYYDENGNKHYEDDNFWDCNSGFGIAALSVLALGIPRRKKKYALEDKYIH